MGREVRRVPANWKHPYDHKRRCLAPLLSGSFAESHAEYVAEKAKYDEGFVRSYKQDGPEYEPKPAEYEAMPYDEYSGSEPVAEDYMPDWPESERTHLQMYENTSEGTPISPVFATPEELARWLADNGASSFAGMTATYEQWLRVCTGGYAPSMVLEPGRGIMSGVEALSK